MTDATSGPWHAVFGSYGVDGGWFILPEGEENWQLNCIAEVYSSVSEPANARLIATAPELYASLVQLVKGLRSGWWSGGVDTAELAKAEAVLAKTRPA